MWQDAILFQTINIKFHPFFPNSKCHKEIDVAQVAQLVVPYKIFKIFKIIAEYYNNPNTLLAPAWLHG